MKYLALIPFLFSLYYFIMMTLGKLKLKNKVDNPYSTSSSNSDIDSTLCELSGFDCSSSGADGGGA